MELIVMLMIVGVFGIWIYGLKQEITTLQKRLPAEKNAPTAPMPASPAYIKHVSTPNPATRSNDGVQTWVLE